jgi:hypothetical protein
MKHSLWSTLLEALSPGVKQQGSTVEVKNGAATPLPYVLTAQRLIH